ncbi:MAG TPA: VCBS repeat-containing protein, partial [Acidobacteriaceae bacterium]|nr:VCBS repeat-containing protein [Acidobacteriaceae bacterium]
MSFTRRKFLQSLSKTALVLPFAEVLWMGVPPWNRVAAAAQQTAGAERAYDATPKPPPPGPPSPIAGTPLGVAFFDEAHRAGINVETIYGGVKNNKYLLETTGCGVAFYDYDHDGWLDIFLVNGWRLEGFSGANVPTCHLFKNNRDGTFQDVTHKAGLARSGWGQG